MKKILFILFLLVASLTVDAQVNFMGIPVDGTKSEMISKLKQKGFEYKYDSYYDFDYLTGMFNGKNVFISISVYKGKVWRIKVIDKAIYSESSIKTQFNILIKQFENNGKYTYLYDQKLDENLDISYEIDVNKKQIEAAFIPLFDKKEWEPDFQGMVWLLIEKSGYDKYNIIIHYDNLSNMPKGEDL